MQGWLQFLKTCNLVIFASGVRLHHELWSSGSSSSDWDEAQAQDGQGRTGDDGQGGGGEVPVGQGRVGQVPMKLNWNSQCLH